MLLHAITDALLGGASLGDIGELFPDTAQINKDRDSLEMLTIAFNMIAEKGYSIIHVDCIVFAQAPQLSPHKTVICDGIAAALNIDHDRINLKAKTGEGIGTVGSGQSIEAQCVALLAKL